MNVPAKSGWVIDFRTASAIFASGSNARINHCIEKCKDGSLIIAHCEIEEFKSVPALKQTFLDGNNCCFYPDQDTLSRCMSIANTPMAKRLLKGNEAAIFVTAIAASKDYGVISNHRSPVFTTTFDFCKSFGIPCCTADEYFELFG
jgi:hypothetical protein